MRDAWVAACGKAAELPERPTSAAIRAYLEANFAPYRATNMGHLIEALQIDSEITCHRQ